MAGETFRFFRRNDLDTWASKEDDPRDDLLRELIDQLPEVQRHLISRVYFGQAHRNDAAAEAHISPRKAKEELEAGLETLRQLLLDGDIELGPLSSAAVDRQSDREVSQPRDVATS